MPPPKKILIVDDEAMIRKAVHLALAKEGYEVVEAETGGEALRRIELSKPDLILLDIMLPDVSGFDVCRDIRKAGLRVPIIILSAKTEEIDVVVGLEIGADDYLPKPFDLAILIARLQGLLRRRDWLRTCHSRIFGPMGRSRMPCSRSCAAPAPGTRHPRGTRARPPA